MAETKSVFKELSRPYYEAVFDYWITVAECGENSESAEAASRIVDAEAKKAKRLGASIGELGLLRISAKEKALNGRG